MNVLMLVHVGILLEPSSQAYLRGAGTMGFRAFEELVALGEVPACVHIAQPPCRGMTVPMHAPVAQRPYQPNPPKLPLPSWAFVNLSKKAISKRFPVGSERCWGSYPRVRYVRDCVHDDEDPTTNDDLKLDRLPHAVHIDVVGFEAVTKISLRVYNSRLKSVTFNFFSNVVELHRFFLDFARITSLNLAPFSNVTRIDDSFLLCCRSLRTLDMSPLINLREVGNQMLSNCTSLQALTLFPTTHMSSIPSDFAEYSWLLTSVDLSPFGNIQSIGRAFFVCSGLQSIDLTPLRNVTSIATKFLAGCQHLEVVDMTPMTSLVSIGKYFLSNCMSVRSLKMTNMPALRSVGIHFCDQSPLIDGPGILAALSITPE